MEELGGVVVLADVKGFLSPILWLLLWVWGVVVVLAEVLMVCFGVELRCPFI